MKSSSNSSCNSSSEKSVALGRLVARWLEEEEDVNEDGDIEGG